MPIKINYTQRKNSALLESGTKRCPKRYHFTDDQMVPHGHRFGAIYMYFFECRVIATPSIASERDLRPHLKWINQNFVHLSMWRLH